MNEYQISNYELFNSAIATIKAYYTNLQTLVEAVSNGKIKLSNESVFKGPIQENCMQTFESLDTSLSSIGANLTEMTAFLQTTSTNYQAGDKDASNAILGTTNTDSLNTTTTANVTNKRMSIPTDPTIAAKKEQWLGDVDDASRYTEYTGRDLFGRHNTLELFDNTTGEIIQDHGKITLKPGETRVITVKLPTDTGMINQITRTTADGDSVYRSGKVVSARSDIDPNPNNIEYVRLAEGHNGSYHEPSNMSLLHNNSYDWIITANSTGTAKASQTCLWSSSMTNGRNLKGMINLNVEVTNS